MASNPENGIITELSHYPFEQTVTRLEEVLRTKGIKLFTLVDHSGEAEKAGLRMPPTKLLIFGSPKAGTPLMLATPSIAIDLPLKILISEDDSGKVWISYNSPDYLARRHQLPSQPIGNIAVVANLISAITD
jgi:uncharacterized protein (DUF302 family)